MCTNILPKLIGWCSVSDILTCMFPISLVDTYLYWNITSYMNICNTQHVILITELSCFFEFVLGDDQLLMVALRCLGLLLIPTKTKGATEDIPFLLRIVPVSILIIYYVI